MELRSSQRPTVIDAHKAASAINLRDNADQVGRSHGGGTQDFLGWTGALSQSRCGQSQR